ncbi:hypothetical protein BYT27DRAFT_7194341 [Phlegmacium glaucopus]|nr:hypothetical protein BYT27DRAFT_7194341 [Phlegmacium glaucopus]
MKNSTDMYRLTLERLISEVNGGVNGTLASLRIEMDNHIAQRQRAEEQSVASLQESSEVILREHATRMYSIADALDTMLNHRIKSLFARHEVNYQRLDRLTIGIHSRLQEIDHEFSMMKQAVSLVSDMTGQILSTQILISQKADLLSEIQSNASDSALGLVKALTQMTDTAHNELDKINGSAWLIQEQLRFQKENTLQWKGWLTNILAFIYKVEPSSFGNLEQLLSFRLFLSVFTFCWNVFRAIFSALTSMIFIFFFISRKFVLKKSARILSSAFHPLSYVSQPPFLQPSASASHTSVLPGSGGLHQNRQRVSRIPDRLCRPSPY